MKRSVQLFRAALMMTFFAVICTTAAAAACVGMGTVTGDALRLRADPSTSSTILSTAGLDDRVLLLADEKDGWYQVDYKTMVGYMSADYLKVETKADADLGWGKVDTGGDPLNLRAGPSTGHDKIASLPSYSVVKLVGVDSGWFKVSYNGQEGYVSSDYILPVQDESGARSDGSAPAASDLGARIVEIAKGLLGKRYVYGGKGPNTFDCSGFTLYVYKQVGITIPAGATQQYLHSGVKLSNRYDAQPGDLVFINDPRRNGGKPVSHVGIYIGGGQFIHASTQSYKVQIDNLFTGYHSPYFNAAKRVT